MSQLLKSQIINPDIKTGNSSSHKSPKATSNPSKSKVIIANKDIDQPHERSLYPINESASISPIINPDKDIIIKQPILLYDKVNQGDLLIDLDACNSEYKSFEKRYNDNHKIKIYTGDYSYSTRINEDYYQYGSSYLRFIKFARDLLNTGDNLPQDYNVKAKKKELRKMLSFFEAYLRERMDEMDEIYDPELKGTLDMTKKIVNKINTLYGSKLYQSYLRTITKIRENMGKVPSKLLEAVQATVQTIGDKFDTNPPDTLGIAIDRYNRRTAENNRRTAENKRKTVKKKK
jgi:hypothetical protein